MDGPNIMYKFIDNNLLFCPDSPPPLRAHLVVGSLAVHGLRGPDLHHWLSIEPKSDLGQKFLLLITKNINYWLNS